MECTLFHQLKIALTQKHHTLPFMFLKLHQEKRRLFVSKMKKNVPVAQNYRKERLLKKIKTEVKGHC